MDAHRSQLLLVVLLLFLLLAFNSGTFGLAVLLDSLCQLCVSVVVVVGFMLSVCMY